MPISFTPQDVQRIAALALLSVASDEEETLAQGFTTTMAVVDKFGEVDVSKVPPTHHVTGLENVFRDDVIDEKRMFTQDQALANGSRTYNGFFVVDQILINE